MEQEKEQRIPHDQIPEGPGYTPQERVLLPEDLVARAARHTPASKGTPQGPYLNVKTGQVVIVDNNPPAVTIGYSYFQILRSRSKTSVRSCDGRD